jgi:type IV pilus assembly protein PilX
MRPLSSHERRPRRKRHERGVIMVIALITLAVLLIGAAAAMRSMNVTLSSVGFFGFKRDMTNQAERGLRLATTALSTGALAATGSRWNDNSAQNYSARMLPSDASGIPLVMLNMTDADGMGGFGAAGNVIRATADGITVHYLIDRICIDTGAFNPVTCQKRGNFNQYGNKQGVPTPPPQPTYRITVRVTGPNNAYSFYQSTFTTLD